MFFFRKSKFSTKNIVKIDLKNILGKDKVQTDISSMLKYYVPIPNIVFERTENKLDIITSSKNIDNRSKKYFFLKRGSQKNNKKKKINLRKVLNIEEEGEISSLI